MFTLDSRPGGFNKLCLSIPKLNLFSPDKSHNQENKLIYELLSSSDNLDCLVQQIFHILNWNFIRLILIQDENNSKTWILHNEHGPHLNLRIVQRGCKYRFEIKKLS